MAKTHPFERRGAPDTIFSRLRQMEASRRRSVPELMAAQSATSEQVNQVFDVQHLCQMLFENGIIAIPKPDGSFYFIMCPW